MGRRGPKPTPTGILKRRGSRRAAARKAEPQPPEGTPQPPACLTAEALAIWNELVPQLEYMKVLARIDRHALSRYCQMLAQWYACQETIEKDGLTYERKSKEGVVTALEVRPEVGLAVRLNQAISKLEAEFGLTPAARPRLTVKDASGPKAHDEKARFAPAGPA